ncbi:hypothetical protein [Piscirickettsia salmonis]|nr:hypothetical protein [Piscirickettsia salmonis]
MARSEGQAYSSLLGSFAKENEQEELAVLQQGLNCVTQNFA